MSWRKRIVLVALVYLVYFGLAITGAIFSRRTETVDAALIIAVILPTLHFASTTGDMLWGERPPLPKRVGQLVVMADWASAFALGLASAVVSRHDASEEREVALASNLLSALAQCVCALKTYTYLDSTAYDQTTGESLDF